MSLPGNIHSREWLQQSRDRMSQLEDELCSHLPAQIYALLRVHPCLTEVSWFQHWPGIYKKEGETRFMLEEIEQTGTQSSCCEVLEQLVATKPNEDRLDLIREHSLQIVGELEAFLRKVPVCVLVRLFGHSHWVTFFSDHYTREFVDQ